MLLLALLLAFAPKNLQAQATTFGGDPLDAWRAHMAERLDSDLARVATAAPITKPDQIPADQARRESRDGKTNFDNPLVRQNKPTMISAITRILQDKGLPTSLLGVVAVESGFNPQALSPKGARGLWQIMPRTARRYGLVVSFDRDDRLDPMKSTYAAADYLKDLYAQFGNWPLALAAYNAGEDRVEQALERAGVRNFWTLRQKSALPEETRHYVPAVLARMNQLAASPDLLIAPNAASPGDFLFADGNFVPKSSRGQILFATPTITPDSISSPSR
jgi:soluble lytic murein transglycosylase-like protein